MALKTIVYWCTGCREEHKHRIKEDEVPRRSIMMTCPKCQKYRRMWIAGPRPITRKDVR